MRLFILFTCFFLASGLLRAQDTNAIPAAPAPVITQQVSNISDSLHQLTDSFRSLKTALSYSDFFDSSTVARLEKDATPIYTEPACNKYIYRVGGWLLFVFTMLGGLILFGYSSICRDEGYDENGKLKNYKDRPFSYSRVQLFWWTMIILGCYVAFFAIYGHLVPLNMTTVILLGLGAVVLAGGTVIDQRQKNNTPTGQRSQDQDAKHDSFFRDILSDNNGISIHRFQTVVFNMAFGIGFVCYFVTATCTRDYPFIDFNSWQFALLGISSATYLGMKATENGAAPNSNNSNMNNNNGQQEQEAQTNINQ